MDRKTTQKINRKKENFSNTIEQQYQPNTHLWNTSTNHSKISILLNCTGSIPQDKPYTRP